MFNLDSCLSVKELNQYIDSAESLMNRFGLTFEEAIHLRDYAEAKKNAIEHRLEGNIHGAIINENVCDNIYRKMSPKLRW